ncbi:MAG TPA: response regulator [Candidatus Tectomicrobia bacterium]|nr:response regulator [Candidatus Tectomicrobia bacterium]
MSLRDVTVLLVEDDADSRDVLQTILEARGARVTAVGTAHDALAALDAGGFDVVVTDLAMPRDSGFRLVARIRERGLEVGVLAVTGHPFPPDGVVRAGFDEHLLKPVDPEALAAAVARLARRRLS